MSIWRKRCYYLVFSKPDDAVRFRLWVTDRLWLAVALEFVVERLLELLGHPCCGRGLGRIERVNVAAFQLLNLPNRFLDRPVVCLPVSDEDAELLQPGVAEQARADLAAEDEAV